MSGLNGSEVKRANALDALVGARVKRRRTVLAMTQEQLASELGISWQQLQKYEAGTNRISASRLAVVAKILRADIGWFLDPDEAAADAPPVTPHDEAKVPVGLSQNEIVELLSAYSKIQDQRLRRKAIAMMHVLAGDGN